MDELIMDEVTFLQILIKFGAVSSKIILNTIFRIILKANSMSKNCQIMSALSPRTKFITKDS